MKLLVVAVLLTLIKGRLFQNQMTFEFAEISLSQSDQCPVDEWALFSLGSSSVAVKNSTYGFDGYFVPDDESFAVQTIPMILLGVMTHIAVSILYCCWDCIFPTKPAIDAGNDYDANVSTVGDSVNAAVKVPQPVPANINTFNDTARVYQSQVQVGNNNGGNNAVGAPREPLEANPLIRLGWDIGTEVLVFNEDAAGWTSAVIVKILMNRQGEFLLLRDIYNTMHTVQRYGRFVKPMSM